MKRLLCMILFYLCCAACALAENAAPVRIMVASDLHYLAPSLYADSSLFLQALARGDGKASMYSAELLEGFLAEVRHQQPDVLVLSGDLTFNGEKQSHEELAAAMRTLTKEGIPVVVIPGNHDLNSTGTVHYLDNGYIFVDNTTPEDFREIWQGMLPEELPGAGMSGVYMVNDHLWLAMGDYSVYANGVASLGIATKQHMEWMEDVTGAAREAGVTLISVSHQGMLPHTSFATETFNVYDGERIITMLKDAGCQLNLSGHMHLQHILRDARITDIATGAWSVSPHRYGMVTVAKNGSITYDAYTLCAEHVPEGLLDKTREFFRSVATEKQRAVLTEMQLDATVIEDMLAFAADVNEAYFAGTLSERQDLLEHPGLAHWMQEGAAMGFGVYMQTVLIENAEDACCWQSR